jgi:mycoredoxin
MRPVTDTSQAVAQSSAKDITVFWRPGCGFCMALERELGRKGVTYARRNIWEDPDAAAFVRSVARGNETVPTVTVGDKVFVNPPVDDLLSALH